MTAVIVRRWGRAGAFSALGAPLRQTCCSRCRPWDRPPGRTRAQDCSSSRRCVWRRPRLPRPPPPPAAPPALGAMTLPGCRPCQPQRIRASTSTASRRRTRPAPRSPPRPHSGKATEHNAAPGRQDVTMFTKDLENCSQITVSPIFTCDCLHFVVQFPFCDCFVVIKHVPLSYSIDAWKYRKEGGDTQSHALSDAIVLLLSILSVSSAYSSYFIQKAQNKCEFSILPKYHTKSLSG